MKIGQKYKKNISCLMQIATCFLFRIPHFDFRRKKSHYDVLCIVDRIGYGGVERHALNMIDYCARRDLKVALLLDKEESVVNKYGDYKNKVDIYDRNKHHMLRKLINRLTFNQCADLYDIAVLNPKTIIVEQPYAIHLWTFILPCKILYVNHTPPQEKLNPFFSYILNKQLSEQKIIIAVSNFAKKSILNHWQIGKQNEKIHIIENYALDSHIRHDKKNDKMILTVGRFEKWHKGVETWFQIAESVLPMNDNMQFQWVGGNADNPEYFERYEKKCDSIKGINVDDFKLNLEEYYKDCHIYLQPSNYENCPYSLIDALRAGKPCVVSDVGGMPELVAHGINGYLCPRGDASSFVEAINAIIHDRELYDRMSQASRDIFEQKFSKKVWEQKMDSILRTMKIINFDE